MVIPEGMDSGHLKELADFSIPENNATIKLQDFPEFPGPVRTLEQPSSALTLLTYSFPASAVSIKSLNSCVLFIFSCNLQGFLLVKVFLFLLDTCNLCYS